MVCPQCQQSFSHLEINTINGEDYTIEECLNCGGHFLPPSLGNFISLETARNIDSVIPKSQITVPTNLLCHQCGQSMSSIKDDTVPETVTVFTCPNNHGEYFPKEQLFLFKEAQNAKIYYKKLWGLPIKTVFAVVAPVLFIFSAVTVLPSVVSEVNKNQENRVKASEILTPPLITPISDTQVLISFSTVKPSKTTITFTEGSTAIVHVSETPNTNHLQNIDFLEPGTVYKYTITIDSNNHPVTTSEYTFSTP